MDTTDADETLEAGGNSLAYAMTVRRRPSSAQLIDLLRAMPELTRRVIWLRKGEGYTSKQISDALSISEEEVTKELYRALMLMRFSPQQVDELMERYTRIPKIDRAEGHTENESQS